jgi:hypothetical protein
MSLAVQPSLVIDRILCVGEFNLKAAFALLSTCRRLRRMKRQLTDFWQRLCSRFSIVSRFGIEPLEMSVARLRREVAVAKWAVPARSSAFSAACPPDPSSLISQDHVVAIGVSGDEQILDIVANLRHTSAAIVCGPPDKSLSELALINGLCVILADRKISLLGVFVAATLPTTQLPPGAVQLVLPRALSKTRFTQHDGSTILFANPTSLREISPLQHANIQSFLTTTRASLGVTQTFDLAGTREFHKFMAAPCPCYEKSLQVVSFRVQETSAEPPAPNRTLLFLLRQQGSQYPSYGFMDT